MHLSTVCPVVNVIQLISKRWVLFIFMAIRDGNHTFNAIRRAYPTMSAKILSERLLELEEQGYIDRSVLSSRPIRIEYTLTEKGKSLEEAILTFNDWALKNKDIILS